MRIIDTSYHLTFSGQNSAPDFACIGKCKKVWWEEDFKGRDKHICPMCSGELTKPSAGVHYTVISSANRELKFSDFKKVVQIPHSDKKSIKAFLENGSKIGNLSIVKPAFIEKAKKEWCS